MTLIYSGGRYISRTPEREKQGGSGYGQGSGRSAVKEATGGNWTLGKATDRRLEYLAEKYPGESFNRENVAQKLEKVYQEGQNALTNIHDVYERRLQSDYTPERRAAIEAEYQRELQGTIDRYYTTTESVENKYKPTESTKKESLEKQEFMDSANRAYQI